MDAFFNSVMNWNKLKSNEVEMAFKKMLFLQLRKEMNHKIRGRGLRGVSRGPSGEYFLMFRRC